MPFLLSFVPGPRLTRNLASAFLLAVTAIPLAAQENPFVTPVAESQLDPAAFAEWVDGAERPVTGADGVKNVFWTQQTPAGWSGLAYGGSKLPGKRHLRIGFTEPIPVGSVLVKAGGSLSVLKPDAVYPGNLSDESAWLSAERIAGAAISAGETADRKQFAIWVLPPGVRTRALRFTHAAAAADKEYAGWLGGAFVLAGRWVNDAPRALASASSRNEAAALLNNESDDGTWGAWDNGKEGAARVVSPENPEFITLVWPHPVPLRALCALWPGFTVAEVFLYKGPDSVHPREAPETDWQSAGTFEKIENQYPRALGPNWLDLGKTSTTRAVRLRITKGIDEAAAHPHMKGNSKGGRRIWLGELLALRFLGDAPLAGVLPPAAPAPKAAGIPVRFSLERPQYVTLVIEKPDGVRVRNLVSETLFPAGENSVDWDGTNDLLRDEDAARHGIYSIAGQFVEPGSYRVRGLLRDPIDLRYEFSVYNAGNPPWSTADHTGGWLANHTPPSSVLFVPGDQAPAGKPLVLAGSYVSEGGDGLAYLDIQGRKLGGQGWVGGNWTGAPFLARDTGPGRLPSFFAYAGAAWSDDTAPKEAKQKAGEIRLTALSTITAEGNKPILKYHFTAPADAALLERGDDWALHLGGIAVHDGIIVCSLTQLNELLFVDASRKSVAGHASLSHPAGIAFDSQGRLLVLSGRELQRHTLPPLADAMILPKPELLIPAGAGAGSLDAPQQITTTEDGRIFITDRGRSHQVKVYDDKGKFQFAIGHPGPPATGPYDSGHLNDPNGVTVDSRGNIWVAETNFQPKRLSVWDMRGQLLRAFYGPASYGGGGKLDPRDKRRFYYYGMEFALDWTRGADQLSRVLFRPEAQPFPLPANSGLPETPIDVAGRRYFSNADDSNPTGGSACLLWLDRDGAAAPVAAIGRASDWKILAEPAFQSAWPAGLNRADPGNRGQAAYLWSDLNGDGAVQPNEVQIIKANLGGVTVAADLSLLVARLDSAAVRLAPRGFTPGGAPLYSFAAAETLAVGTQGPTSSGGDQALVDGNGWTVLTVAPKPFAPQSMGGVFKGEAKWSYPSLWPGLHASHEAPTADHPGELIGTTRLLGGFVTPPEGEAGPLWAINGNMGSVYLFTADGLFVSTLFQDERRGGSWAMPIAERGMRLNDLSLGGENFWPSITQTPDGEIYLADGARTSLVHVTGLDSIRRLPEATLAVTPEDLQRAQANLLAREAGRHQERGHETLQVGHPETPPVVDGKLDDWQGVKWADIDKSGVAAWFDSDTKPHNVSGALAVSGDRLYAAFRTDDADLLRNTGEMPTAPFKTGGALDLMLGTNPAADPNRKQPVEGDVRLVVTQVKGKPFAVLYRAIASGAREHVPFSSPWRTINFDQVTDVSADVALATAATKNPKGKVEEAVYEFSIPLATLGLSVPKPGTLLRGDLGILRGDGTRTIHRVYWSNKATAITADVPSEAELTPALWGNLLFQ